MLEAVFAVARERTARVLTQRAGDTDKLYAFHAPEVECIAKGKARSRYEFGVEASIAVTNARTAGGQFIVGMQSLPGNPYDGHTLSGQIEQVERLTGVAVQRAYVDRGYRGHKHSGKAKVYIAHTRGISSPTIKRELKRRNAVEPIIGYTKADGLLERNHLAGATGDAINALLVAAGHNLRLLVAWLVTLLRVLITAWLKGIKPAAIAALPANRSAPKRWSREHAERSVNQDENRIVRGRPSSTGVHPAVNKQHWQPEARFGGRQPLHVHRADSGLVAAEEWAGRHLLLATHIEAFEPRKGQGFHAIHLCCNYLRAPRKMALP